jgi:hypothetical protein
MTSVCVTVTRRNKERDHLKGLGIDGRILLWSILNRQINKERDHLKGLGTDGRI